MANGQTLQDQEHEHDQKPHFEVAIGNEELVFQPFTINDPIVTGRQILLVGHFQPVSEHLVFKWRNDGELAELRLDESVDLTKSGVEYFLVFKSDRSFRFELNESRLEWGFPRISGSALKKLAKVDPDTYGVWQELKERPDLEIADDAFADLSGEGVEHFVTEIKVIVIQVNGDAVSMHDGNPTGMAIKEQAIAQGVPIQLGYQLILKREGHPSKVIGDDEHVAIHNGTKFSAIPADDNS